MILLLLDHVNVIILYFIFLLCHYVHYHVHHVSIIMNIMHIINHAVYQSSIMYHYHVWYHITICPCHDLSYRACVKCSCSVSCMNIKLQCACSVLHMNIKPSKLLLLFFIFILLSFCTNITGDHAKLIARGINQL